MCILVLCVGQGEEGDFNHNMEIHKFISWVAAGQWWSRFGRGRGPGGYLNYFLTGERPEVWNPYPYLRIFLPQKTADFSVFSKFSQIGAHF